MIHLLNVVCKQGGVLSTSKTIVQALPELQYPRHETNTMSIERQKGGRPQKSEANKKTGRIAVFMTKAERELIKKRADEFGVTLSEYCSMAILNLKVEAPFSQEEIDLKRGLVGMANNLNQIAYKANAAGIDTVEHSAKELLVEIKKELEKFR